MLCIQNSASSFVGNGSLVEHQSVYYSLNHLNGGNLTVPGSVADPTNLFTFEQDEFFDGDAYGEADTVRNLVPHCDCGLHISSSDANMGSDGLVFIPPACQGFALCKLHVHFHGCGMQLDNLDTDFVERSGFLDTAEVNDIVVIFPQVKMPSYLHITQLGKLRST